MNSDTTKVDTDAFWINLARDAFSSSSSYFDTNIRNRIINDIKQFQSEHPEGSKYYTDSYKLKSKLFRPKTRSSIRKNEATAAAAFFSTEDVVAVRPMDDEDEMQQAGAEIHKALLQYRLTKPKPHGIPWFLTLIGAYQDAQSVGVVASFQEWVKKDNKRLDRPDVKLLPIENVRFDPAADWRDVVESSPYFIIQWPMYVKDIKARMARKVLKSVEEEDELGFVQTFDVEEEDCEGRPWKYCSEGQIIAASQNANDTIRQTRENRTDSKNATAPITDYSIVWVHQNFVEIDGIDVMYYTLGTQQLLSDPIPTEEKYPQGRPLAVGFSILEAHKTYPSSVPTITRDIQGEINDVTNLRIDNVKLMLNKRHIVKRGASVDLRSLTRNIPGSVTLANDPNSDIRFVTTDDATSSSYQEQDRLNLDYDDLSGAFSGSSVASNRKLNETVGGMNILTSQTNQISEYQLRTFTETWVEVVLRQLIILEQAYETDERVLAIVGKQAKLERFGFNEVTDELMMQDTVLNVSVGTGAINPQTQVERFAFGMKTLAEILGPEVMKKIKTEEVVTELFGKLGYKDGKRFFDMGDEDQDPRLAEALQVIEQLKQELAMKTPPELLAAQVSKLAAETDLKKVEATNKRVESLFSAMNTAQVAVQVPGVTPVADAIAKSAGFEDQDVAPIYPANVPQQQIPASAQIPSNTSPNFPANPENGMMSGIESGEIAPSTAGSAVQYDNEQGAV
jgi:hypothetical protein